LPSFAHHISYCVCTYDLAAKEKLWRKWRRLESGSWTWRPRLETQTFVGDNPISSFPAALGRTLRQPYPVHITDTQMSPAPYRHRGSSAGILYHDMDARPLHVGRSLSSLSCSGGSPWKPWLEHLACAAPSLQWACTVHQATSISRTRTSPLFALTSIRMQGCMSIAVAREGY
jgi:hypothetical protein